MGRYIGPKDKLSRREGVDLFGRVKNPLQKRNYPPGIHGPTSRKRLTTYGAQLREKQKAKRIYGLLEKQFKNYYKKALAGRGNTGESMLQMLELRLDNVVYRSGFTGTRSQARQLVNHRFFLVNGIKVDIPSFQCKIGDIITLKENKTDKKIVKELSKKWENKDEVVDWISLDKKKVEIKIVTIPQINEKKLLFDIKSIIEFYSK